MLDLPEGQVVEAWLVFRDVVGPSKWYMRLFKNGFKHVEIWLLDHDVWVRLDPCFGFLKAEAHLVAPWRVMDPGLNPTYLQHHAVLANTALSSSWIVGPVSCVEVVKLALGIRSHTLRTPFQLYKFLTRSKRR